LKLANIPNVLNLANLPAREGEGLGKDLGAKDAVTKEVAAVATPTPNANPQPQIISPQIGKLRSTATLGKPIVPEQKTVVNTVQEPQVQQNKVFTLEELQVVWDGLVKHLESEKRFSEYVILNRTFTLNGTTIHLEVDNDIQVDLLTTTLRTEILTHIRQALQNSSIHLEVVVSEVENTTLIYTQADKFKFLAEKNPAMNELRTVLGLDYDY
jgi:DNA polymerase-3 subunit gamma/tau